MKTPTIQQAVDNQTLATKTHRELELEKAVTRLQLKARHAEDILHEVQASRTWGATGKQLDRLVAEMVSEYERKKHIREWLVYAQLARVILDERTDIRIATKDIEKNVCACCGKPLIWFKEPNFKEWHTACPTAFLNRLIRIRNLWDLVMRQLNCVPNNPTALVEMIRSTQNGKSK
jgi:hypothetical protein